jgi:ATP-dependent helicase HrpB
VRLPIDDSEAAFLTALREIGEGGRLVLSAPTGSGKSTRVPLWCAGAGYGPVLVIEPRRIACRTLAEWLARAWKEEVGQRVGFSIRFEQCCSDRTEILFVTPGVARRLLLEGALESYGTVIFDEFHERSWETDVVMAALAAARGRQRLLLMSATLAAARLVQTYEARHLECFGRSFPVQISYHSEAELTVPSSWRLVERVCQAIEQQWDKNGGTLVFLPGLVALHEVKQRLPRLPIRLLHGSFAQRQQDDAFDDSTPRIVLATNVAESSLTLPGITLVIDSGLEKRPVHQAGYVALSTVPIATSSADQRAGRAGRTAPGRCLRLWDEKARLEASRPPDLERMELDELLLFLAGLPQGLTTPLSWLDRPPAFAWERALERLRQQGLVADDGRVTALGATVGRLPLETSWARILALAPPRLQADLCDLYALSHSRRSLLLPASSHEQAEQRKKELGDEPWGRSLALLRQGEARRHGLDEEALREARLLSQELRRSLEALSPGSDPVTRPPDGRPHPELSRFLASHWPERHFVRRANREAWGNGQVECRTARGEEPPEEVQAALFLQIEPVVARGLRVELRGRWPLPVSLSSLRQAGYGVPELSKIRIREGTVWARVAWLFAGRTLAQEEDELKGPALRQALVQLAQQESWQRGLWEAWTEYAYYGELEANLADRGEANLAGQAEAHLADARSRTGDTAPLLWEPSRMLLARLEALGVESSEELALLEPADLQPPAVEESLRRAYPRHYLYGGAAFEVRYQPGQRRVRLCWRSGPHSPKINAQHLPRWNGWRVELDERGRVTPLR